jgi:hypothetical protein
MDMQEYIPINLFCSQHQVEITLMSSLQTYGLIELIKINDTEYIQTQQLAEAESIVRLYRELDINPEGIDAIINLLHRIKEMQTQIQELKNRLKIYEEDIV